MRILISAIFIFLTTMSFSVKPAVALTDLVSLQVHNPNGPGNPESAPKSQFVMRNDSDPGVTINSILWTFASPLFIDSTSSSPGFGSFLNYTVSPAQTYGSTNPGEFQITVGGTSNITTGYTGPTSLTNGAISLLLTFNSFDAGEAFAFWTDLDTSNNSSGQIIGNDFNGSKTKVTFSNGYVYEYTWNLAGNNGKSFFAYDVGGQTNTAAAPEPMSLLMLGGGLVGTFLRKKLS